MTSVRERIFEVLRAHGMTTMFGNPGSTELPFLQNYPEDFEYVLGLQEASVVALAVGYAFLKEEAALVNLHTTAGTGNAMGAIVTAWHAQAPIVITAGQQDRRQIRAEPFLWGRQADFVKPYVKWSIEPHLATDIPGALERAYHVAMSEPRGPVFVSIPMDGMDDECPAVEIRKVSHRAAPDPEAIREFAKILSAGKEIALIAGEEIDAAGATSAVVELAERLQAPVYLSPLSHTWGFPTRHELFRGELPAAMAPLAEKLSAFDTVLVVGSTVFNYYPYIPGPVVKLGTKALQITNDPNVASRSLTGLSIVGNIQLTVKELLKFVERRSSSKTGESSRPVRKVDASIPPSSEYVQLRLAEAIPSNAIVFNEAPTSERFFQAALTLPHSHYQTASGGLGFAMPAAVGAALAQNDRPVVCITGDGSAQYSIQALWTAARRSARVTFIVMNNGEYAILKAFGMLLHSEKVPGLDVPGIDFEGLAKGYGVDFRKITKPEEIAEQVRDAISSNKPNLIDLPIDPKVGPLLG
jgi:benzoylformate decarboxylase